MSDEEFDETADQSAEEWQAEAGRWKQKAYEAERAAAEHADAAARLAELEKSAQRSETDYAEQLKAAAAEGDEKAKAAKEQGDKSADDWRAEAEKWKQLAQKNEQLAKGSVGAARALEKMRAEDEAAKAKAAEVKAESDTRTAETKADLEAKATQAELKAMRLEVAKELGVPIPLVELLAGQNKREIEQSADRLMREVANNKQPEPEKVKAAEDAAKQEAAAKEDGELAQARKALAEAEVKALRLEIATEKQLPSALADMLNARTREELERQADALLTAIGGVKSAEKSTRSRMPTSRLRSGALPDGANEPEPDARAIAEKIMQRSRGY